MLLIWNGFGFLVAVFAFASSLLCNALFDARMGAGYYASHHWTLGIAMLLAAALCAGMARLPFTLSAPRRHTLFFLPVRFWSCPLGAAGVALLALECAQ